MKQTEASKSALQRDKGLCRWHLARERSIRTTKETHHIFRRSRVDEPWGIISLCRECHDNHHRGNSPTTEELIELMGYGDDIWLRVERVRV